MYSKHIRFLALKAGALVGLLGIGLLILRFSGLSPQSLLAFRSEHPLLLALLFLLLYALKSATLFFPLILLETAVGLLFPLPTALGLNFAGTLVILTVPFWIGRWLGTGPIRLLLSKYPRVADLVEKQNRHSFFLCFFLRVLSCLPGDAVTMYLGATRVPFWQNLLAGSLGTFPGMILATLMGSHLQDPTSPAFWLSVLLSAGLAGGSTLLYFFYIRRGRGNG
jgi:uncharacterized membrane protein YdjX (TVP38/TMEM64 family)